MRDVQPLLKNKSLWWLVFLLSSVSLSWVFQIFKLFTLTPNVSNAMLFAGAIILLVFLVLLLVYDSYVKEKQKDNIHNKVPLFEWFYSRQQSLKEGGRS